MPYGSRPCDDALGHCMERKVPERGDGVLHIVPRSWYIVPVEQSRAIGSSRGGASCFPQPLPLMLGSPLTCGQDSLRCLWKAVTILYPKAMRHLLELRRRAPEQKGAAI
jgi:hypothetical protein